MSIDSLGRVLVGSGHFVEKLPELLGMGSRALETGSRVLETGSRALETGARVWEVVSGSMERGESVMTRGETYLSHIRRNVPCLTLDGRVNEIGNRIAHASERLEVGSRVQENANRFLENGNRIWEITGGPVGKDESAIAKGETYFNNINRNAPYLASERSVDEINRGADASDRLEKMDLDPFLRRRVNHLNSTPLFSDHIEVGNRGPTQVNIAECKAKIHPPLFCKWSRVQKEYFIKIEKFEDMEILKPEKNVIFFYDLKLLVKYDIYDHVDRFLNDLQELVNDFSKKKYKKLILEVRSLVEHLISFK